MTDQARVAVSLALQAAVDGDQGAAELLPLLYTELRKLAQDLMYKTPPATPFNPPRSSTRLI